jgi:ABC-type amino acid transport system permease subunit
VRFVRVPALQTKHVRRARIKQNSILFQDTRSIVARQEGRLVEMYIFAALVYFVIYLAGSLPAKRQQKRMDV